MLNNRPDLVAAAGADGVHIDRAGIDLAQARATIGPEKLLGTSTHTPEEIDAAQQLPLDYISVGPVHATPTRPGRPAVGYALVTYASRNSRLPFFAVGGIEPHNTGAVAAAGAQRIAVVRAITEASDPERSAAVLRAEITAPADFLERYRARTEAQNAAARAQLEPLAPGERPWPLRISVAARGARGARQPGRVRRRGQVQRQQALGRRAGAVRGGDADAGRRHVATLGEPRCCCSWRCWRSSWCCSRCS